MFDLRSTHSMHNERTQPLRQTQPILQNNFPVSSSLNPHPVLHLDKVDHSNSVVGQDSRNLQILGEMISNINDAKMSI